MANPFDQFDQQPAQQANPFDQFDQSQPTEQNEFLQAAEEFDAGLFEPALTLASGAIAAPISGLAGLYKLATGGDSAEATKAIQATQEAMTYQPRTQQGQQALQSIGEFTQGIGEAVEPVTSAIGEFTEPARRNLGIALGDVFRAHPLVDLDDAQAEALGRTIVDTSPVLAAELLGARGVGRATQAAPQPRPQQSSGELFEGSGIRASAGEQLQAQRSPEAFERLKEEAILEQQSSQAGQQMREFRKAQSQEIKNYLEGAAEIEGVEPSQVGDIVKQALEQRKSKVKANRRVAYDKLAELTKDSNVSLNTQIVADAMPDQGDLRDFEALFSGQYRALDNLLGEFGVVGKEGVVPDNLSVGNYERFRKRLNAIEKSDPTGNTSRIVGPIREALDSEFEMASKALEAQGSPDVARAAKNARLSHIALKTEFDEKGLVDQLIAPKARGSKIPKIEDSKVYAKLVTKATPVEEVGRVVSSLRRAGEQGQLALGQIKSQMLLDLIDSGFSAKTRKADGQRLFGANAFSNRFDELEPKLKEVLSTEEFGRFKKFRDSAEDLIPDAMTVPRGSAPFLADALEQMGVWSLMSKIPGAGPIVADQIQGLMKSAKDSASLKRAMQNPKIKETADLIEYQYPALANVLGIGAVMTQGEEENADN